MSVAATLSDEAAIEREHLQDEIDQMLVDGLNSGSPIPVDETFWENLNRRVDARLGETASLKSGKSRLKRHPPVNQS